jgi:hypothetical protein
VKTGFLSQDARLHEETMAATGLSDFGDPVYREGLRQLLAARDVSGIDYPHDGETILGPIRQTLATRLVTLERIKQAGPLPPVTAPIFVLGLPRTGTTAMQRLLRADPQHQGLEYWLGEKPKPRPPRADWATDPDFIACRDGVTAMAEAAPMVLKLHPMAADEGEECRLVMEQSFGHSSFSLVAPLRPYQDWLFAADLTPHYQHFKHVLGLIGANDPGQTWVLKCPHHAPQVESLLSAFPDARIILMHRPVEELIPSVARLADAFLALVEGPGVDMPARAALITENLDLTLRRLLAARKGHQAQVFDLTIERFVVDPLAAVETAYAHFGIAMDEDRRAALTAWVAANHGAGHGAPASGPLPYGLNRDALRERFHYYQGHADG